MRIIIPKGKYWIGDDVTEKLPIYFLAGPIRGGGDWQAQMCDALAANSPTDFVVACPCRWGPDHRLSQYFARPGKEEFPRQLEWEQWFMQMAANTASGCIIFWLGLEDTENPHPGPEPYAMDTRGEIGEWRMRMKYEDSRVILGAHEDFFGLSQIQRNFEHVLRYTPNFYSTIQITAYEAIRLYGEER